MNPNNNTHKLLIIIIKLIIRHTCMRNATINQLLCEIHRMLIHKLHNFIIFLPLTSYILIMILVQGCFIDTIALFGILIYFF